MLTSQSDTNPPATTEEEGSITPLQEEEEEEGEGQRGEQGRDEGKVERENRK